MSHTSAAEQWNHEYESGRYQDDPPIPFINTVLENLDTDDRQGFGLYVGCGNGRNYVPLADEIGARLHGMDISSVGISQIREKRPDLLNSTAVSDFGNYVGSRVFSYILAIQVFQHGNRATVENLFGRTTTALRPGGKFFLRVNSVATEINYEHDIIEGDDDTGKTIIYKEGPKTGGEIHFFAKAELEALAQNHGFSIIAPLVEKTEERDPPHSGTWAQWEAIWQKRS